MQIYGRRHPYELVDYIQPVVACLGCLDVAREVSNGWHRSSVCVLLSLSLTGRGLSRVLDSPCSLIKWMWTGERERDASHLDNDYANGQVCMSADINKITHSLRVYHPLLCPWCSLHKNATPSTHCRQWSSRFYCSPQLVVPRAHTQSHTYINPSKRVCL